MVISGCDIKFSSFLNSIYAYPAFKVCVQNNVLSTNGTYIKAKR